MEETHVFVIAMRRGQACDLHTAFLVFVAVIMIKHFDRRVVRRDASTGAMVHSADFANTYYHPSPVHIMRKKTCFDGRVHIELSSLLEALKV